MRFENIRSIRPLTKLMLELLQDCYHKQKHNLQQGALIDNELMKGLITRGLMQSNPESSREGTPYLITDLGREYIEHYFGK